MSRIVIVVLLVLLLAWGGGYYGYNGYGTMASGGHPPSDNVIPLLSLSASGVRVLPSIPNHGGDKNVTWNTFMAPRGTSGAECPARRMRSTTICNDRVEPAAGTSRTGGNLVSYPIHEQQPRARCPRATNRRDVTKNLQQHPDEIATIIGKTDTVGSPDYNMHLSHFRADAVRDALVYSSNIAADRVETRWTGETRQRIATADNVPEAPNRVVDIAIH